MTYHGIGMVLVPRRPRLPLAVATQQALRAKHIISRPDNKESLCLVTYLSLAFSTLSFFPALTEIHYFTALSIRTRPARLGESRTN